jgi:hypothetical protein
MSLHKRKDFDRGFMDVYINIVMVVFTLFILAMIQFSVSKASDANVRKEADFVIEINWDPARNCDVDLWVQDPQGNAIYFGRKENGLMHLERDDLGWTLDRYTNVDGSITKVVENREIATLRGTMPGEYIVNVHEYACRGENGKFPLGTPIEPIKVEVKLIQINPYYNLAYTANIVLENIWEEETAFTFQMNPNKGVFGFSKDQYGLVENHLKPASGVETPP